MTAAGGPEIGRVIERFDAFAAADFPDLQVRRLGEWAFALEPRGAAARPPGKCLALVLMGLTHGNEWAGGAVLTGLLAHLHAGTVRLRVPVGFVLGNPDAALANRRFLETDLNRSFARQTPASREERRARELQAILGETALLVDFHQVTQPTDRAFFIFPYRQASYDLARMIAPAQTIVTHWGAGFSTEGMCTDEYVNSCGGTGISVELGQNGLDPFQVALGIDCALWSVHAAERLASVPAAGAKSRSSVMPHGELYTWAGVVPWPSGGVVELDRGWTNFREVAYGQRLGTVGGTAITAPHAGKMLFPKYLAPDQQGPGMPKPAELCRIMRRIDPAELPR